jgi:hypothetical protein
MILPKLPPPALSVAMMITSPPNGPALAAPLFLPLGADANARGPHGYSALMMAAASEALPVDALRMLIEKGADVNARSADGMTALSFARLRGTTPVVDLLLKAGAKDNEVRPMPSFTYAPAATPRDAVARALPLVQHSDREFMKKSGCVSCHNNTLAAMTVAAARTKGLAVDEQIAGTQVKEIGEYIDGWRDRALQGIGIPGDADTVSYILLGLAAEKHPATVATDAMARFIKGQQRADGHWELLAHRPPIESSRLHVTALSMRALQLYAPKTLRADYEPAIRKAAGWIAQAQPVDTQDRASKLLGLAWSGARKDAIKAAVKDLVKQQRADGGWSQLPTLQSDAYATGQALYALSESGMSPSDRAYRKGVSFLLRTQLADGSWFVKSRAVPLQPHFEAGFPHGKDQFISAAATNWAAIALARAASPARGSTASAPEQTR